MIKNPPFIPPPPPALADQIQCPLPHAIQSVPVYNLAYDDDDEATTTTFRNPKTTDKTRGESYTVSFANFLQPEF